MRKQLVVPQLGKQLGHPRGVISRWGIPSPLPWGPGAGSPEGLSTAGP